MDGLSQYLQQNNGNNGGRGKKGGKNNGKKNGNNQNQQQICRYKPCTRADCRYRHLKGQQKIGGQGQGKNRNKNKNKNNNNYNGGTGSIFDALGGGNNNQQGNQKKRNEVCRAWKNSGNCRFGSGCKFYHDSSEESQFDDLDLSFDYKTGSRGGEGFSFAKQQRGGGKWINLNKKAFKHDSVLVHLAPLFIGSGGGDLLQEALSNGRRF
ncbi:hypothetical protein AAMO2058_000253100 [Amorphochlora amoebiformis]